MLGVRKGMSDENTLSGKQKVAAARDARLKASLKANMARRKAQAKVRKGPKTETNE